MNPFNSPKHQYEQKVQQSTPESAPKEKTLDNFRSFISNIGSGIHYTIFGKDEPVRTKPEMLDQKEKIRKQKENASINNLNINIVQNNF